MLNTWKPCPRSWCNAVNCRCGPSVAFRKQCGQRSIRQMTDWPLSTTLRTPTHCLHRYAFLMISPAHTIHHIGTCFASSMMPHQDPGSVLYVKAKRGSRGWWRGLDFSPCTAQQVKTQAMHSSLRNSFILEFAGCLTLGPLKRKAMLPSGRSRARTVHCLSQAK